MERARLLALGLPRIATLAATLRHMSDAAPSVAAASAASASAPSAAPSSSPSTIKKASPAVAATAAAVAAAPSKSAPAPVSGSAPKGASVTEHVFLTDSYLFELSGCKLLEAVLSSEQPKDLAEGTAKLCVVLSRTVFHPQGGGQPADNGALLGDGLPELAVSFVSMRKEDGAILHDCVAEKAQVEAWMGAAGKVEVACRVDESRRRTCARLHSAGHLLDAAVTAVGLKWVPGKGYHFPDGPYVEYVLNESSRKIDPKKPAEKDAVVNEIQSNIDRLVAAGGLVTLEYKEGMRHVAMAGEECPCGGTHVADISQIGQVQIKKLQNKQGNVRLSYTVASAA